jgi:hypothetical protein
MQSRLQIQFPNAKLLDLEAGTIVKFVVSDVPERIVATTPIQESAIAQQDATLLFRFRRGLPSFDDAPLVWSIVGETGEIRLTNPAGTSLNAGAHVKSVRLEVKDFATNTVEHIDWRWETWQEELPLVARCVGALYEAFAEGKDYPTFEEALKRHEQLDGMLAVV